MLTTDQKGAIAEAAITHGALELGIGVAKPSGDERYDLIFDLRPQLVRVQCKWAVRRGDVVVIRCYGSRRNADGLLRRFYTEDEIDAFAAYCADVGRCCFLPFATLPAEKHVNLRLSAPRSNQRLRINWAEEFEFAATLGATTGP